MNSWAICLGPSHKGDKAIEAAIEDLQAAGERAGARFEAATDGLPPSGNAIVVGNADRNPDVRRLVEEGALRLEGIDDPQGYEIRTHHRDGSTVIVVAGGSPTGDVYGLYWMWDRMRVRWEVPELDVVRKPALPVRLTHAGSEAGFRDALRYTATWVSTTDILDLVPWDVEPEKSNNAVRRAAMRRLAATAHGLHLKLLVATDEFAYHPALLKEFGAELNPADPAMWAALQAKYRRLFTVLPELDGVQIRTGELTRVAGNYRAFDVMHGPDTSGWSLDQRYRTFVQKLHEVVVGEFDKIYFHRTWVCNTTEQHSDPEVYRSIFTEEVPTRNLYLSPYLNTADRWYYQPYNPTFNQTPHNMLVLLATQDYHAGGGTNVFPSYPGQYFQGGLEQIMSEADHNLRGIHFGMPAESEWSTRGVTAYLIFRLAWEPEADLREIAEDYAAIYVGRDAAPQLAEILLLSQQAYKDGIYIKPVAESLSWNTLPHLRITTFDVQGFPRIDAGREHIEWLRSSMYEPSKGRIDEALEYLERGRGAANRMAETYVDAEPRIADRALAKRIADSLELTRLLVETNLLYVKTCYAYFQYREEPGPETKERLAETLTALKETREKFARAPGFEYKLFGIDQLIDSADDALEDLERAEARFANAPDEAKLAKAIQEQQKLHAAALKTLRNETVRFLSWRGKIDGVDVLSVSGDEVTLNHIQSDAPHSIDQRVFEELPAREVTVLLRDVESQTIHPYVLEQPTEANGYTAKVCLCDRTKGYSWWEFELYYVDKPPAELGLAIPWQEAGDRV